MLEKLCNFKLSRLCLSILYFRSLLKASKTLSVYAQTIFTHYRFICCGNTLVKETYRLQSNLKGVFHKKLAFSLCLVLQLLKVKKLIYIIISIFFITITTRHRHDTACSAFKNTPSITPCVYLHT